MTSKHPEIPLLVRPAIGPLACSGLIRAGRDLQLSVDARNAAQHEKRAVGDGAAPGHPCPLICGWVELPEVIQVRPGASGINATPSEQPKLAVVIDPSRRGAFSPRRIRRIGRAEDTVNTRCRDIELSSAETYSRLPSRSTELEMG